MFQTYLIDGLIGAALIVFAAGLRSALLRFEGESTTLSSIIFGAGVSATSVSLVQGTFVQVLANHIAVTGDAGAIRTLLELDQEADTFKLLPLGLLVGATSFLAMRADALPRWLGWSGAVLSLLLVVAGWSFPLNSSALSTVLTLALVGLLLWVAAMGGRGLPGHGVARGILESANEALRFLMELCDLAALTNWEYAIRH